MLPLLSQALCLLPIAFSLASPLLSKRSFPPTEPCSGVCRGRLHDPSVVYRADTKTFYRFTTNNEIIIATAPHLSGPWTNHGPALPHGSRINLSGKNDLWAPDVFHFEDTYYLYYSVSTIGSRNSDIGVATSPSMEIGSWTDHGSVGIPTDPRYNKIDANFFQHSPSSPPLLQFGSYWQDIYQIQLATPPLKDSGAPPVHLAQNLTGAGAEEGSYMFQWGGFYYLFFSSGMCCNAADKLAPPGEEYKIMVCRSAQPSSGFVDAQGTPCLESGGTLVLGSHDEVYAPGGQGVMYDPVLRTPVVYYHYVVRGDYAYDDFHFGWNKLSFDSGWPVVTA